MPLKLAQMLISASFPFERTKKVITIHRTVKNNQTLLRFKPWIVINTKMISSWKFVFVISDISKAHPTFILVKKN